MKLGWLGLFFLFAGFSLRAQTFNVSGQVTDAADKSALPGTIVLFIDQSDTSKQTGIVTDVDGNFGAALPKGVYKLRIELISYKTLELRITLVDKNIALGSLVMQQSATLLKETIVEAKQTRVEQNGDTTAIHAGSYKTNPDATTEDLLNKMPGVSTQSGTLTVNGEQVKQIYVDGKPFFGDDPGLAIKNLPAEIVDKIQIYDKSSDQSQFTGFDDGNSQKTINIITKPGKNNGEFGKVYGGIGLDDSLDTDDVKYIAGGNMNFFNGARRISILGLSNNINQQNFSSQDLLGVSGNSGNGGNRGGMGGGGNGGGGGNAANNFLVGQQGGITQTHAAGLNYSDDWGKKIKVSGSYFFNDAINNNNSSLSRNYILASENGLRYNQTAVAGSTNSNHRANLRFEYNPDSSNAIIFTPKFSTQQNTAHNDLDGYNIVSGDSLQSRTTTHNVSNNNGYDVGGNLLYRHKFKKQKRTVSLNVNGDYNPKTGNSGLYSLNEYYNTNKSSLLDQQSRQNTVGYTIAPTLAYTEPLGLKGQLQISYNPSVNRNDVDKRTYSRDSTDASYNTLDTALSNKFNNTYNFQRGGVSYRYQDKKMNFMLGVNGQYATLTGTETFPYALDIHKNFTNVLPQGMFNYRFSKTKNLRVMYRTNTVAPGITQLQNVINNNNPLLLSTGNPDLKQDYEHTLNARFSSVNTAKATNFMVYGNGTYILNYIANSTLIPTVPTYIGNNIYLPPGSQLSKPVNLNGYWNARSFVTYGFPVSKIKSNLNLNAGFTYNLIPSLINDNLNKANNYNFSGGLVLSSNISQKLDFTLSYTGNYSIVKNTLQKQSDNNYFNQLTSFKFNWLPYKGFVFNTSVTHTLYSGLSKSYNLDYILWNASAGYKFLKDQSLDVRLTVFDILKQNNSVSRNVTDTYIEDSRTQVLTRYFMLMVTYTFKHFNGMKDPTLETKNEPTDTNRPPRPEGGWQRGQGGNGPQ